MKNIILISFTLSMIIGAAFAFFIFDDTKALSTQSMYYVHPLNNLFLFMSGVLIGCYRGNLSKLLSRKWALLSLVLSILGFVFLDTSGDRIHMLTNINRFILSFFCVLAVLSIYKLNIEFKGLLGRSLHYLGQCSYSIYMIHPIILLVISSNRHYLGYSKDLGYVYSFLLTLILSGFAYRWIEKPFIRFGNQLTTKTKASLHTR